MGTARRTSHSPGGAHARQVGQREEREAVRSAQGQGDVALVTAPEVAVLDLDGTLVDSVYVHATAWREAFREVGLDVPTYRLHRAIGMGGDRLVSAVAGDAAEDAVGDVVRNLHDKLFEARLPEVHELEGASELLEACRDAGLRIVLASSSQPDTTDKVLSLVDKAHLIEAVVPGSEGPAAGPRPGGDSTGPSRFGLRLPRRRRRVGRGVRRAGGHPLRRSPHRRLLRGRAPGGPRRRRARHATDPRRASRRGARQSAGRLGSPSVRTADGSPPRVPAGAATRCCATSSAGPSPATG